MAYGDYIHCAQCAETNGRGHKLIYDGYYSAREILEERFGEDYEILCPMCIASLRSRIAELERERDEVITDFRALLERNGFRRCDIPACNCGSWHQVGGFAERFREIEDATEDYYENGETLLDRVKRIVEDRDHLGREVARLREALDHISGFDCAESYTRSGCGSCPSCIASAALAREEE